MTRGRLIVRDLAYYWRANLGVVAGLALASAVVCGALVMGDSLRGTLHDLAVRRLAGVDWVLQRDAPFRESLAEELAARPEWPGRELAPPAPVLRVSGTAVRQAGNGGQDAAANRVTVWGVDGRFRALVPDNVAAPAPGSREAVVGADVARELGAREGDALLLVLPRQSAAVAGSLFGRREARQTRVTVRVTVRAVTASAAARFSLRSDDFSPRAVFLDLAWLQEQLGLDGQANVLLLGRAAGRPAGPDLAADPTTDLDRALGACLRLEDYGLRRLAAGDGLSGRLAADRLLLPGWAIRAADEASRAAGVRVAPDAVYLANSLTREPPAAPPTVVPYSVVAALPAIGMDEPEAPVFVDGSAWNTPLADHEIVVNEWTSRQLALAPGDAVRLAFYVAGRDGDLRTTASTFTLRGILPMGSPLVDAALVPRFEGITDSDSLKDWDPPFPIDLGLVRPADEDYWRRYRTAPKAYLASGVVRQLWNGEAPAGGDGDWITGLRLVPDTGVPRPAAEVLVAFDRELLARLAESPGRVRPRPVRAEALAAAAGTTDFASLFLGLSLFLVGAALLLAALLLRLNLERRAAQVGLLLAVGLKPAAPGRILGVESLVLVLIGSTLGVPLGLLYARQLLTGLAGQWHGALGTLPRLELHVQPSTLLVAWAVACVTGQAAAWWACHGLRRVRLLTLLSGWRALTLRARPRVAGQAAWIGAAGLCLAVVPALLVWQGRLATPAAFFAVGSGLLLSLLAMVCTILTAGDSGIHRHRLNLWRLVWAALTRAWLRSLLTVAVLACATFLLVVVAASRRDAAGEPDRDPAGLPGSGGFGWVVHTELPLHQHLEVALAADAASDEEKAWARALVAVSCRVSDGDEASCLNVQRPAVPRVLGVPAGGAALAGFRLRTVDPAWRRLAADPWGILALRGSDQEVPAFVDANSAQWVLHRKLGDVMTVPAAGGVPLRLRLVGLLEPSILAGDVVIDEAAFIRHFGDRGGYRRFLVRAAPGPAAEIGRRLGHRLRESGVEVRRTGEVLAALNGVQNTYLATFQTLGSLGLILGVIGLGIVTFRNLEERRPELALRLALGFRPRQVVVLAAAETGLLLVVGVAVGGVCGAVAGAPAWRQMAGQPAVGELVRAVGLLIAVGLAACGWAAGAVCRGGLVQALRRE